MLWFMIPLLALCLNPSLCAFNLDASSHVSEQTEKMVGGPREHKGKEDDKEAYIFQSRSSSTMICLSGAWKPGRGGA